MKVESIHPLPPLASPTTTKSEDSKTFASLISRYTQEVNHDIKSASKMAADVAMGKGGNSTEALLAMKKAGLSFQLMLASRNKLVEAYREVIRMQV
ncbi:MAG: flagellar hook-basal body complex protein FliE [Mariprofundales bacterium]|nr:flagellar hook-basal body complex protein FliE [Mariprofundales bacterium]